MLRGLLLGAGLLGALVVSLPVNAQAHDPLAPARNGAVECLAPNTVARTCAQITAYRFSDDGRIEAHSVAILENDPQLLLHGSEEVHVRDDMVCTRVVPELFAALRFTIDGEPAPEDVASELRSAFASLFAGVEEACTRSTVQGEVLGTAVFFDGVEQPELADTVIWIRRDDGYTLGAPDSEGV